MDAYSFVDGCGKNFFECAGNFESWLDLKRLLPDICNSCEWGIQKKEAVIMSPKGANLNNPGWLKAPALNGPG
jgi:hypothetical protein